jgi:hypothetical protein
MCIISKQILLYGSDVRLYSEKAFQNNIKSIYMYPAHIYTTQYKETKLHQSSREKNGAEMSSHHISTKRMKLEKSSSFVNPFEYVHFVKD